MLRNIIILSGLIVLCSADQVRVHISDGNIKGDTAISLGGRPYYSFPSIPFAKSPLRDLRFELPQPVTPWNKTLDVRSQPPSCFQYGLGYSEGQEDCLYLSVYSPELPSEKGEEKLLPVLVWLHGGAFIVGSSSDYSPKYIMDRDIVLVVPQYRLGIMGFNYNRSPQGPGNNGLHDQIFALEWVQKNIHLFGGSKDRVTLGGEEAGGASAIALMLAPLSRGLFHGVMSFYGSPINPWSKHGKWGYNEEDMSVILGCSVFSTLENQQCLKDTDGKKLMKAQKEVLQTDHLVGNEQFGIAQQRTSGPTPDYPILLDRPFLHYMLEGNFSKVPILIEVPKDIGFYLVDNSLYHQLVEQKNDEPAKFMDDLPQGLAKQCGIGNNVEFAEELKDFYMPKWNQKRFNNNMEDMALMLGDMQFNAGLLKTAEILSKFVSTKMLRFDYMGGPKLFDLRHPVNRPKLRPAVSYGDELFAFLPYDDSHVLSKEQEKVKDTMLNIIEDFVYQKESDSSLKPFNAREMFSNVITKTGELQTDVQFASMERRKMLRDIFNVQYKGVLNSFEENKDEKETNIHEASLDQEWHEEL